MFLMRTWSLPALMWLPTVPQSQDVNPHQAKLKIHTNPTAPSTSLYRTFIYIPWDCLNSLPSAFLIKNSASVPPPLTPKKIL